MSLKNTLRNASWALSLLAGCFTVTPLSAATATEKCLKSSNSDSQNAPTGGQAKCYRNNSDTPPAQQPKSLHKKKNHSKSKKLFAKGWFSSDSAAVTEMRKTSLHLIVDVLVKDKSIEIENNAGFSVTDADSIAKLQAWKTAGAKIRIMPNGSWFSDHTYLLENATTQDTVEATLTRAPFENSPYNRRISEINTATGEVAVQWVRQNNGQSYVTTWRYLIGTSWNEQDLLKNMQPGDIVIVGDNSSGTFFSSDYSFILINIATDDFVTAKQNGTPSVSTIK